MPKRKILLIGFQFDITDQLIGIKSKHLLVIADSCFSGTLTRGLELSSNSNKSKDNLWVEKLKLLDQELF